jgi:hypothetical protein
LNIFRTAAWLDRDRVNGYAKIILGVELLFVLSVISVSWRRGNDFLAVWAGAKMVALGRASAAYDVTAVLDYQARAGFNGAAPFISPPPYLALVAPLGQLDYLPAMGVWLTLTAVAYSQALRTVPKGLYWPALCFCGGAVSLLTGQCGLLTSAMIIGAIACLERRKLLAGLLVGAMIIKPHLAVLFPVALVAAGKWRTVFAAAATVAALLLLSGLLLGWDVFHALAQQSAFTGALIQSRTFTLARAQGVLSLVAGAGAPMALAWTAQGVASLMAAAAVWFVWSRETDGLARAASFCAAAPLATPYVFSYDLPLLVMPLVWMARNGMQRGFRPWRKLGLATLSLAPVLFEGPLASAHLAPVVCAGLLAAVVSDTLSRPRRGDLATGPLADGVSASRSGSQRRSHPDQSLSEHMRLDSRAGDFTT